jgi:excisionase family DNA binding protein
VIDLPPLRAHASAAAPVVLRLSEAAATLGLSTRTIRRLVGRGDLEASRVGRTLLIEPRSVAALLARTRVGGA